MGGKNIYATHSSNPNRSTFFIVQHRASPRADKWLFHFEWCHDEAFPPQRKYDKELFPVFCKLCGHIMHTVTNNRWSVSTGKAFFSTDWYTQLAPKIQANSTKKHPRRKLLHKPHRFYFYKYWLFIDHKGLSCACDTVKMFFIVWVLLFIFFKVTHSFPLHDVLSSVTVAECIWCASHRKCPHWQCNFRRQLALLKTGYSEFLY